MAVTYEIDTERRIVVVTMTGVVTVRDLERFSEAADADAHFDRSWPVLVDVRNMASSALPTDSVVSRASRPRPSRSRVAIVAVTDAVYGLARMFQMLSEGKGGEVSVFRRLDEAEAWLGLAPDGG